MEELEAFLQPWHASLEDPGGTQEATLRRLLQGYARTRYGIQHGAGEITTLKEYQTAFPAVTYPQLKPLLEEVMRGHFQALLPEPPVLWALTRGTTGQSKYIPITATDLEERVRCGARGLLNYVHRTGRYDILQGYDLNLNFPSVLGSLRTEDEREIPYGYSSGIYAKYNAERARIKIVPTQEEIDALGTGITRRDWERRFELAYEKGKDKDVTMVIGVTQVMIQFGAFLKRRFGVYPKDLWKVDILLPSSIAGIQTRYRPALRGLYGPAAIVEMYGATEGLFAQQLDERPYVVPNYDTFFFEVETRRGIVPLTDLRPGEHGSLIVSTYLLPRYRIGDLVTAFGGGCYRCIGREGPLTYLRYLWDRLISLDFQWA